MSASKLRARHRRGGYSLVEVLVAMTLLLVGVVGIVQFYPPSLKASSEAALRGKGALLAQQKVEELRRDAGKQAILINTIAASPAPTVALPFPEDDRLTYTFWGESFQSDPGVLGNPADTPGVPRVIVRYNAAFRPSAHVLYELRFDR